MKKLFAIAMASALVSGLYAFSVGLGVAYDNIGGPEGTDPFISIKGDVMVKPFPVLGFRIGVVDVDLMNDDMGGTQFVFATGCEATVLLYIPMQAMVKPYIPFYFLYADMGDVGPSALHFFGGLGAEMDFGAVMGYLEGRFDMMDVGEFMGIDPDSENWFTVQGGVRIPVGL